jgi:hypothetical protein
MDDTTMAANIAGNYIWENNMNVGCVGLNDANGTVLQSVWFIDDQSEGYVVEDDVLDEYLVTCYNTDPIETSLPIPNRRL